MLYTEKICIVLLCYVFADPVTIGLKLYHYSHFLAIPIWLHNFFHTGHLEQGHNEAVFEYNYNLVYVLLGFSHYLPL